MGRSSANRDRPVELAAVAKVRPAAEGDVYRFGPFSLKPSDRLLGHRGEPLAISPRLFELLVYLVRNRDRVISSEELLAQVWRHENVVASALPSAVRRLRRLLSTDPSSATAIVTVRGHGYRFVAPTVCVRRTSPHSPEAQARHRRFVGRGTEVGALLRVLAADRTERPRVLIRGAPGVGKSALLREVEYHLRERDEAVLWLDLRLDVATWLAPLGKLGELFAEGGQASFARRRGTLLVDHFDEGGEHTATLRRRLVADLPPSVALVRVGRSIRPLPRELASTDVRTVRLGNLGPKRAARLLRKHGVRAADAIELLHYLTDGHPGALVAAAHALSLEAPLAREALMAVIDDARRAARGQTSGVFPSGRDPE